MGRFAKSTFTEKKQPKVPTKLPRSAPNKRMVSITLVRRFAKKIVNKAPLPFTRTEPGFRLKDSPLNLKLCTARKADIYIYMVTHPLHVYLFSTTQNSIFAWTPCCPRTLNLLASLLLHGFSQNKISIFYKK